MDDTLCWGVQHAFHSMLVTCAADTDRVIVPWVPTWPLNGIITWVNYNDLTATSLVIIVSKGNHPKMGLIQVSEIS